MRRLTVAPLFALAALSALLALAASTASAAGPPDPCALLTGSDASTVLGSTPAKPEQKKTAAGTRSCIYAIRKKTVTVQTARVATQAAFDRSARKGHGLAIPVEGVGADAWSVSGGKLLLIWKNGIQVSIAFGGVHPFVATQEALAKAAVGRL